MRARFAEVDASDDEDESSLPSDAASLSLSRPVRPGAHPGSRAASGSLHRSGESEHALSSGRNALLNTTYLLKALHESSFTLLYGRLFLALTARSATSAGDGETSTAPPAGPVNGLTAVEVARLHEAERLQYQYTHRRTWHAGAADQLGWMDQSPEARQARVQFVAGWSSFINTALHSSQRLSLALTALTSSWAVSAPAAQPAPRQAEGRSSGPARVPEMAGRPRIVAPASSSDAWVHSPTAQALPVNFSGVVTFLKAESERFAANGMCACVCVLLLFARPVTGWLLVLATAADVS